MISTEDKTFHKFERDIKTNLKVERARELTNSNNILNQKKKS